VSRRPTYDRTIGEQHIDSALRATRTLRAARPFKPFGEPTKIQSGTVFAVPGEVTRLDTQVEAATVYLAKIRPQDVGQVAVIASVRSSANAFTVFPQPASATIAGAASITGPVSYGAVALMAIDVDLWLLLWESP
jgi:hypothetical protein